MFLFTSQIEMTIRFIVKLTIHEATLLLKTFEVSGNKLLGIEQLSKADHTRGINFVASNKLLATCGFL